MQEVGLRRARVGRLLPAGRRHGHRVLIIELVAVDWNM